MDTEYAPMGCSWDAVVRVVNSVGCQTEHAVAALKVCDNNAETAITFLSDPWLIPADHNNLVPVPTDPTGGCDGEDAPELVRNLGSRAKSDSQKLDDAANDADSEDESEDDTITADAGDSCTTKVYPSWLDLPVIQKPSHVGKFEPRALVSRPFRILRVVWALQQGQLSNQILEECFSKGNPDRILKGINKPVAGVPTIFYVVHANDPEMVKTWARYGGDVNATLPASSIPLLAFAILLASKLSVDTTSLVSTLVALGANAAVIPRSLLKPFHDTGEITQGDNPSLNEWCTRDLEDQLDADLNLTQRYVLSRQARRGQLSARLLHVAKQLNVSALIGLPYLIIGQDYALKLVTEQILCYLLASCDRPLVLVFAGPSGHGKSELGKLLGKLLSFDVCRIDMAGIAYETDLLGPHPPYHSFHIGSRLNNFLADNSSQRAIVFLDEFDKSTQSVWDALLILFDEGFYEDRRNGHAVNTSRIIWVLACNALDNIIMDFCTSRNSERIKGQEHGVLEGANLNQQLTLGLQATFGSPLAGRISTIVPFLPFTKNEQAVIVHKYIRQLVSSLRTPVDRRLIGPVDLRMRKEEELCKNLAENGYLVDTGARSLEFAVNKRLRNLTLQKYLEGTTTIGEESAMEKYLAGVDPKGNIVVERV